MNAGLRPARRSRAETQDVIGIVIVAHGGLAREFHKAVEHVVGRQPGMLSISIGAEDDRTRRQREICDAADARGSDDAESTRSSGLSSYST